MATRIRFGLTLIVVLVLGLAACGDDEEKAEPTPVPSEAPAIVLGLSLSTLDNPFFVSVKDGAETAAQSLNVQVVVEDAQDNAEQQNTQIQALIDQGVSAILINPVDGDAVVTAVEAANAANIPVFTIDRSAAGGVVVSHIASDNLAGGRLAGEYLAETLNSEGKVVELVGIPGTSAAEARGAGFHEAMAGYDTIEIVASEVANFNRDEGKTVFAEILAAQPEIDGVFAHNDEMILGAIEAAKEAGRAGDIQFVGFDAVDDAIAALEAGDLTATVAQQPEEMGRLGVETAVKFLNGESVSDSIPVDLALITK
jgi:ribose transport system substrate-binding protein